MEVSSESGFWEFGQNRVIGRPYEPCRNLKGWVGGREHSTEMAEGARPEKRWEKIERPPTSMQHESNQSKDSA